MTENTEVKTPATEEVYALFRETMPFAVISDGAARYVIGKPENTLLFRRNEKGELIAALVLETDTVLFLGVRENFRRRGIAGELLSEAEELVKAAGHKYIRIGAGRDYLTPGVPMAEPVGDVKFFLPPDIVPGIDRSAAGFFIRRGYRHGWGEDNCFDMQMSLTEPGLSFPAEGETIDGITYRIAVKGDIEGACRCTDDAHPDFTKYYRSESLYEYNHHPGKHVKGGEVSFALVAEADGEIAGTLIISLNAGGEGIGSVGCTAVARKYRKRHIGVNMVRVGTGILAEAGMTLGFLGYTYTGLDRMYGYSGYRVRNFWLMAHKDF
ncbi:MAG: GNAT family N-acetyltransferase [Clostridiales bacterium]|nr:GNAT family N-acetyltransferase [Clostridiales bacterium]